MNKKKLKSKIINAFSHSVPDVFPDIIKKCEEKKGFKNSEVIMRNDEKKSWFTIPRLSGAFVFLLILIVGIVGFNTYNNIYKIDSVVEFDVNPSIELEVNKKEKIIDIIALNDDGKKILKDMDLKDVDLDVAVNAIIGSMLKNGYITIDSNSILVSVKNKDTKKGQELQEKITKDIEELLKGNGVEASVLTQMYNDDKDITNKAEENNISSGKASLIQKVIDSGLKNTKGELYTFEELSKLSINDLNLLFNERKIEVKELSTSGKVSESSYIGKDKAKTIALSEANVKEKSIFNYEIEVDSDDGILMYEIEFDTKNKEYEYDINALTGEIINKEISNNDDYVDDKQNTNNNTSNGSSSSSSKISKERAKEIALNKAGVSTSNIRELSVELDNDDGKYIYEVEFESGKTEYKYDIDAYTGKILEIDVNTDD